MSDLDFDFGFTAVTEDELDVVKKTQEEVSGKEYLLTSKQDTLDNLYNAIMPLLSNLKKNPEKEYILWPNRLQKVEEFEDHINKIYTNNQVIVTTNKEQIIGDGFTSNTDFTNYSISNITGVINLQSDTE